MRTKGHTSESSLTVANKIKYGEDSAGLCEEWGEEELPHKEQAEITPQIMKR